MKLVWTQVFLRESLEHRLEKQREVEVLKAAMIIQAHVMGYVARFGSEQHRSPSEGPDEPG